MGLIYRKKQNKNKSLHKFLEKMAKKPLNPFIYIMAITNLPNICNNCTFSSKNHIVLTSYH